MPLAHEKSGLPLVKLTPMVSESLNSLAPTAASYFWAELQEASKVIPGFWAKLAIAQGEQASTVYQAAWLAREVRLKGITHLHAHFGTVDLLQKSSLRYYGV